MVTVLRSPQRPLPDPGTRYDWQWEPGHRVVRVYHRHPDRPPLEPRTYGPFNRFDPHIPTPSGEACEQPDGRGVNYFADDLACALAEAFPDQPDEVQMCPNVYSVVVEPTSPERLLDLTGDGAMFIGAVATLASGAEPRALTQEWARAIYEDLPGFSGIRYRAAHQGGEAIAIWDRAGALLPHGPAGGDQLIGLAMLPWVLDALERQRRNLHIVTASDCERCIKAGFGDS